MLRRRAKNGATSEIMNCRVAITPITNNAVLIAKKPTETAYRAENRGPDHDRLLAPNNVGFGSRLAAFRGEHWIRVKSK